MWLFGVDLEILCGFGAPSMVVRFDDVVVVVGDAEEVMWWSSCVWR
jgi:hypothetical protein